MVTSTNLAQLPIGKLATVSHYTNDLIAGKLIAMGILPGSPIKLLRKAPLGGGWYVEAAQNFIALRRKEALCIVLK